MGNGLKNILREKISAGCTVPMEELSTREFCSSLKKMQRWCQGRGCTPNQLIFTLLSWESLSTQLRGLSTFTALSFAETDIYQGRANLIGRSISFLG